MFIKVWLSLGSNLGDRLKYLNAARQALSLLSPHKLEQSTIYESAPWGGVAKGTFLNQIIGLKLSSDLLGSVLDHEIEKNFISKYQLDSVLWLERLQFIKSSPNHIKTLEQLMLYLLLLELKYGRNRKADAVRWDSRTLDLDILAIQPLEHPDNQFNSDIFCHYLSPYLELPHPRLKDRQFILKPWFELVPQLYLSSLDAYLRDLLHDCPLDESLHVYSISLSRLFTFTHSTLFIKLIHNFFELGINMIKLKLNTALSYRSMISCAILTITVSAVQAEPNLAESRKGIAPTMNQWVLAKPQDKSRAAVLSTQDLKDPQKLLAFLKTSPDAIDPSRMSPFIAIEVGKTLLYGGEVSKAVQLLNAAKTKWPQDLSILQSWAQALIKSGQPSYVRTGIESWQANQPGQSLDSYTQYLHALSIYLEGPQDPRHLSQASSMIDQLLSADPNYIGPDGINAARLRSFKAELLSRLSQQQ